MSTNRGFLGNLIPDSIYNRFYPMTVPPSAHQSNNLVASPVLAPAPEIVVEPITNTPKPAEAPVTSAAVLSRLQEEKQVSRTESPQPPNSPTSNPGGVILDAEPLNDSKPAPVPKVEPRPVSEATLRMRRQLIIDPYDAESFGGMFRQESRSPLSFTISPVSPDPYNQEAWDAMRAMNTEPSSPSFR